MGDWSLRPDDGQEFAGQDIVPYHALRSSAGKDRSDPAILLENANMMPTYCCRRREHWSAGDDVR